MLRLATVGLDFSRCMPVGFAGMVKLGVIHVAVKVNVVIAKILVDGLNDEVKEPQNRALGQTCGNRGGLVRK